MHRPRGMRQPPTIGLHCSHEQHPPSALLRYAKRAAEAGFTEAMCSDHFHPWSDRQGHAGFSWSWLGAALATTRMSFGTVCAPGQRYHPAIVAQAAATLAEMHPGRFWLAVGSGEALNESITGAAWPERAARNARLEAAVEIIRALWAGETVSRTEPIRVSNATLYDRPAPPPMIVGAALSPETARSMGRWADALITIAGPHDEMQAVVEAFREGGGESKPMFLQVTLSYAPTAEEAAHAAFDQWRQCVLTRDQLAGLRTPQEFDAATAGASPSDVLGKVRSSPQIERHLDWLRQDASLGFQRLYLHNVARAHQDAFIDAVGLALPEWQMTT